MMRPMLGTVATRVIIAACNLLLIALAAQALGLEGVGRMSLLLLTITLVMVACNVVGGGALVYLEPRHGTRTLRWIACVWSALACLLSYPIVAVLNLAPEGFAVHACTLALLESLATIHLTLLLGRERYGQHNALQVFRAVVLLAGFAVLVRFDGAQLADYAIAFAMAQAGTAVLGFLLLARQPASASDPVAAASALFRQGLPAQAANGLQLLNYRLSYYLIDRFQGAAALGLWSITTQLAESAWLVPKSLGSVLYARVSNLEERDRQRDATLAVLKISVAMAALAAIALIALPSSAYQWVFGEEATGIGRLVAILLPGLLAMSASQALSHFLSGSGRVAHNMIASGLAMVVTATLGFLIIPAKGATGAAVTASAAYCTAMVYQALVFRRFTGARLRQVLPDATDIERLRVLWQRLLKA
jgi:O-antigen/teichoic acid export membrane protein